MKKTIKKSINIVGLLLCLFMLSFTGTAQTHYTMWLANMSSTSTTMDMDVMFSVDSPSNGVKLSGLSVGINYNTSIVNGGTLSLSYVGGKTPAIANLVNSSLNAATAGHLRIGSTPLVIGSAIDIPAGTYRLGTYRVTNTASWASASDAQLWLQPVNTGGKTLCAVNSWPYGATSGTSVSYTVANSGVTLNYTQTSPLSVMLNAQICATTASQTASTAVTCFGGNNGTSTITMSPTPTVSAITYTVDGGSSQSATLSSGAFTVSGLTAGAHTIVVSNTGCSNVTATGVSVSGPSQLTNSTTATACDSYVWSVNGTTYTSSGTYTGTTTNSNGCTVNETLNLTINHSSTTSETQVACDSYTWNGTTYTTSGTYTYSSTNGSGCTNVATLNLTINHSTTTSETQVACDSYTWNGTTYTTSGTYTYSSTNGSGCTNVATLHLTINNSTTTSETQVACDSYIWNGTTYTTSGTYTFSSTNASGCTNVATLLLTINHSSTTSTTQVACDSYTWNGTTYTTSGTYTYTSTNGSGCTNVATLNLTINHSSTTSETQVACDSYTWNGTTYTTSGTYTYTGTNASGCTNVATLHLTINNSTTSSETQVACDVYRWHGTAYSTSGTYTYTSTNSSGCTDVATLHLTINHSSTTSETQTACDSYTWNGTTYTTSGTYTYTSTNSSGCDNIATLHLTINNSSTTSETQTACNNYTWHGTTYTASGDYTYSSTNGSGCTTVATLHLTINNSSTTSETQTACDSYTWNGSTYTTSGDYTYSSTNGSGCTNVATLHLTINSNAITAQSSNPVICALVGATASVSVTTAGSGSTYQWYSQGATVSSGWTQLSNNVNYSGVTSATLNITRTATAVPAAGTKYQVVVSGSGCTSSTSAPFILQNLTVLSKAAAITVVNKLTPALTTCQGSSVTLSLAAKSVGNIQWQSSTDNSTWTNVGTLYTQTAVSALNPVLTYDTGALTQSTWFRVLASNGVCSSVASVAVKITVSLPPTPGTISGGDVTVCAPLATGFDVTGAALTAPITNSTTLSLNGVSFGAVIAWQKCINYTAATPTWTAIAGATSSSYIASALAVDTWYRALVTNGACSGYSNVVKITVTQPAKAGATTCAATVCLGGDISFTSAAYTGGTIQWQVSTTSATGPFTNISGATSSPYTLTGVSYPALSKFYIRSMVTSGSCTAAYSAVKTITVTPLSVGGTVTGGGTVCNSGVAGTLKLAGNTGTIQWQYSTDNSTWSNAPSSTGTAATFTTTSANSTAATYIVANVTANTYFRALVTSGVCSSTVSNAVEYVVASSATAGTVSAASTTVCSGTGTTLTLSGSVGAITWQKSVSPFTTWTAVTTSVTPTLNTGNLTATTHYRASVTIGSCSVVTSNEVVLTVPLAPVAKAITANTTTPSGAVAQPICTSSTTAKILTIGSGSVGAIQWQVSTTSATTGFTDIAGQTGTSYTISSPSIGVNYYRASFTNSCGVSVTNVAIAVYYTSCLTDGGTTNVVAKSEAAPFGVIAYPSPFTESFNLNLTTSSEDKVQVMVYDMIGKLIDQKEVSPSEATTLQVGDRYPSGVYNVIVTQGENTKTLRVIKR